MPCPWRETTARAVEMPENDALAELKFKRSLRKTSPPLTFSYSLPLGTTEQKTKMRRRRIRRAEFNLSLFMGIKLFFPPAWSLESEKRAAHTTQVEYTVRLHTHCSSERCLWIQISETNNTLNLVGKTHICTFLEFCYSGKCYRNVKGCLCSCALWFIAQR